MPWDVTRKTMCQSIGNVPAELRGGVMRDAHLATNSPGALRVKHVQHKPSPCRVTRGAESPSLNLLVYPPFMSSCCECMYVN